MKRIVILIDGTWNKEGAGRDTNVAKLHKAGLIKAKADDGTVQHVYYHPGVGTEDGLLAHWLGGTIGLGLRRIVQEAYVAAADLYQTGDDLILCGFSRGAYAVRALAGMIGKAGLRRRATKPDAEAAWARYRATPPPTPAIKPPTTPAPAGDRRIRCVAVWDTVGSYGVPAGLGLDALGRYITWAWLGFKDTRFGDHIDVGLHAVAIDERRRPFVPTFWTSPKARPPRGHVEQTWFAGAHSNVGGGEPDSGLSDEALLWMIARLEALTGLAFDHAAIRRTTHADVDGEVNDSTVGWPIDHLRPHLRRILSPDATAHGAVANTRDPTEMNINERVHWSVLEKLGRRGIVFGRPDTPYRPENLPPAALIRPEQIAAITAEERALLGRPVAAAPHDAAPPGAA